METDNTIRFDRPVNEETTAVIEVTFKDEDGVNVNPGTAKYTLYNLATGAVINSRTAVDVPGDAAVREIELTPADNVIVNDTLSIEEHRLYIRYEYGASRVGSVEVQVIVRNMTKES